MSIVINFIILFPFCINYYELGISFNACHINAFEVTCSCGRLRDYYVIVVSIKNLLLTLG